MDIRDASAARHDPLLQAADSATSIATTSSHTTTTTQQGREALKDILFGSTAGVAGKYVEYPFDTIKVRLQSQPSHLPLLYTGPLDCFRQSLRQDGFMGLYRGISAPLVGAALETSSLFFSYRVAQNILQATVLPAVDPLPLSALVGCGAMSGAFTSLLLTPIELVKCKMQVPLSTSSGTVIRHPGPLNLIASIYRHHGLSGFWHGQMGTLIREMGGSAAWFGSYEGVSALFRNAAIASGSATSSPPLQHDDTSKEDIAKPDALPLYQQMTAGAIAGMSYNFIFYPADTIKSRMQTEEVGASGGRRQTFWTVGRELWTQHGIRGMYRGCGITVGRAAPSSALIFSIYEGLRQTFA